MKRSIYFHGRRVRQKSRYVMSLVLLLLGIFGGNMKVYALEPAHGEEAGATVADEAGNTDSAWEQETVEAMDISMLDEVDFTELDELLDGNAVTGDLDFKGLVKQLISGEEIDKQGLFDAIKGVVVKEVSQSKGYMIQIVLLVAAFALLYNFANVFQNAAVTDISFYIVYMILLALLMKSFLLISGILNEALGMTLSFMRALMPAFCLTMVVSTGTLTAMGFYQLTLMLLYLIEAVLLYGVVPAVHIYIVLELLNHLTREEMISRMTELIKTGVEWVMKCLFTLVIGVNVIQGLLNPVIDGLKTTMFARTAGMIPGIGSSISAVAEVMVGSGVIIKNGVGVAGILVVVVLCAGPLIKVGIMTLMYKLSAAVIQPIADKRLAGCISGMGEGARLLGKVLVTANVMLLLTIALVTAATTWHR